MRTKGEVLAEAFGDFTDALQEMGDRGDLLAIAFGNARLTYRLARLTREDFIRRVVYGVLVAKNGHLTEKNVTKIADDLMQTLVEFAEPYVPPCTPDLAPALDQGAPE